MFHVQLRGHRGRLLNKLGFGLQASRGYTSWLASFDTRLSLRCLVGLAESRFSIASIALATELSYLVLSAEH